MRCSTGWRALTIAPCVIFHVVCKSVSVRSLHRMARGRAVCRESVGRAAQSNPKPQRKRSKEEVAKNGQAKPPQGRTPTVAKVRPRKNAKTNSYSSVWDFGAHGRDAGRRGSSPRIGVKGLVLVCFECWKAF